MTESTKGNSFAIQTVSISTKFGNQVTIDLVYAHQNEAKRLKSSVESVLKIDRFYLNTKDKAHLSRRLLRML